MPSGGKNAPKIKGELTLNLVACVVCGNPLETTPPNWLKIWFGLGKNARIGKWPEFAQKKPRLGLWVWNKTLGWETPKTQMGWNEKPKGVPNFWVGNGIFELPTQCLFSVGCGFFEPAKNSPHDFANA